MSSPPRRDRIEWLALVVALLVTEAARLPLRQVLKAIARFLGSTSHGPS